MISGGLRLAAKQHLDLRGDGKLQFVEQSPGAVAAACGFGSLHPVSRAVVAEALAQQTPRVSSIAFLLAKRRRAAQRRDTSLSAGA